MWRPLVREQEDGDLGVRRHLLQIGHHRLLFVDQVDGLGVERVQQDQVDGTGLGQRLGVGKFVESQPERRRGRRGRALVEFLEAVDRLRLAIFFDGEVGFFEAADGISAGVGDVARRR